MPALWSSTPRWIVMWATAAALYAAAKWLTYRDARAHGAAPDGRRAFGYLVAWPGMDAAAFFRASARRLDPPAREWIAAGLKTAGGATLIWGVARTAYPAHPLAAGWIGMIGIVLVLHFGLFHLLSLEWRRAGVDAAPLMRQPLLAESLAEFWGRRWNTAFHDLAERFTFRPLRPLVGAALATLLVFLASGLVHELVISVPAGGGYGLPTAYFLIQAAGVAPQRTRAGRRLGLARGWRGRAFTAIVAAVPAFWLFPPVFVRNVVLPMLAGLGAIPEAL